MMTKQATKTTYNTIKKCPTTILKHTTTTQHNNELQK